MMIVRPKMRRVDGKWVVNYGKRTEIFDEPGAAWAYIFVLRTLRPKVPMPTKSLWPVNSLVPITKRKPIHATFEN